MAPVAITEDYYMLLGVDQAAAPDLIVRSYRRLALKLHPDRNAKQDTTKAFQQLQRAYETLKDESERRKYDLIYPSLKGRTDSSQYAQESNTTFVPNSTRSETAQIAALVKSKQERATQWRISKMAFGASISKAESVIRQLEQEIKSLIRILAAEGAEEAWKNSWGAWLLSPIVKRVQDSDEVRAQKDIARQERKIERDMKERRLEGKRTELKTTKASMEAAKNEFDAADLQDDAKIRELHNIIWRKESWERQEKDRVEREKRAREMRQQQEQREKMEREAAEARRRQQEAVRLAQQKRQEEEVRKWQKIVEEFTKQHARPTFTSFAEEAGRQNSSAICAHGGWWPKVQGRAACPECHDSWTYLLQCPGCAMKACPKCQAAVRPRRPRNATRAGPRARPRVRTPSPTFDDYDYGW